MTSSVTSGVSNVVTGHVTNHDCARGALRIATGLDEEEQDIWDLVEPERESLERLKRVSRRNKSWFAVLNWKQRRFMDAVIMTVDRIQSLLLLKTLAPLVKRLLTAIGGDPAKGSLTLMARGAYKWMKVVAEKIIQIAEKWGNNSAREWLNDRFVRYLMIMSLPKNRN